GRYRREHQPRRRSADGRRQASSLQRRERAPMADDKTRQLGDAESRILARLDMMERRFGDRLDQLGDRLGQVETRLSALEKTVEDRLRETRPIWERALAEIMATQADVRALHSKLD